MIPFVLVLALPSPASQTLAGDAVTIAYNAGGTWNDAASAKGALAYLGGAWVEFTYPGTPWQQTTIEYESGGTSFSYGGNTSYRQWTVVSETDASTTAELVSIHEWTAGVLTVLKTESWDRSGLVVTVAYEVTNDGAEAITNLRLMHAFDPDQDGARGLYTTVNDTLDLDGDGVADWAQSVGPTSGYTVGMGACEPPMEGLGHTGPGGSWSADADATLKDSAGATADDAVHWRHTLASLGAGRSDVFGVIVVFDATAAGAQAAFEAGAYRCDWCDVDGDGYLADGCAFAEDCDDADPSVHVGAPEVWYDGIDQDCDGGSDYDKDGDGYDATAYGGDDCLDNDPASHPAAIETWYDGIDQDCSGGSDFDQDGDGHDSDAYGGRDCDDGDPTISPDAPDVPYDGVVTDCDPSDEYDADGDGHDARGFGGEDCDDAAGGVHPGAPETWYDGVDQDCDGNDDDQDGDGVSVDVDCDDEDEDVSSASDCVERGDDDLGAKGCSCATPGGSTTLPALALLVGLLARRRRP